MVDIVENIIINSLKQAYEAINFFKARGDYRIMIRIRYITASYIAASLMFILVSLFSACNGYSQAAPDTHRLADHKVEQANRNILILHSYHQGYEWTDAVHKGIIENLVNIKNITIFTEYLDAQRNRSDEYLDLMEQVYLNKYKARNIEFDLIIASDDNALQFLKARNGLFRDRLLNNVPIVFCGINNFDPANFEGLTNYTGVNERISVKETVELALKLRPKARKMAVISGCAITEQRNLSIFRNDIEEIENRLKPDYLNQLEPEELENRLKEYDKEDIIMTLGPLLSTPSGRTYKVEDTIGLIKSSSDAAIFGFWDFLLPFGVLGGKVSHGYSQGERAAQIANRILNGTPVDEIPVLMESPNRFVFNDTVLHKYNISHEMLPPKSIIMNKTVKGLIEEWDNVVKNSFFGYEMFQKHGSIMWIADPVTATIVDANQSAIDHYGYPHLTGMKVSDINVAPDKTIQDNMLKAQEKRQNFFLMKHRLANGNIIDVEIRTYPVMIDDATFLFTIINDITDRLQAEQAVKKRDAALKERNTAIFFIVVVALLFQTGLIFYLYKNIRKRKRAENSLVKSNEELRQLIIEHKKSEDSLIRSEQEFREIFNSTNEAIMIDDALTGRMVDCNNRTVEMYGYNNKQEILDGNIGDLSADIAPYSEDMAQHLIKKAINQGSHTFEWMAKKKNGEIFWVEVSLKKTEIGGKDRILAIARDITERKKAEEEKERLQTQLIQAQKMESVGRLAGGVAHDFNNMLGVILGHAELALEEVYSNRAVYDSLFEIQKAAQRSAELTRQLLAFARKQTAAPKVLDLNKTVGGMLNMLKRLIGENIELTWLPGQDLWKIMVDPSQIDQILANLCVNAKDAISGDGKLTITTRNITLDRAYCDANSEFVNSVNNEVANPHEGYLPGDFVMLTVSDNGSGMDKETLEKIFEPFFTTKDINKGTGLGLATVYGIVKQNKGYINVYSELAKRDGSGENITTFSGTTFNIYLPRYTDINTTSDFSDTPEPLVHGKETILLTEDEPTILNITKMMLERLGYTVLAAETPGRAIELATEYGSSIRLLMTDVVMPEMNGRDLALKIKTLYPEIRCLFMSGYTSDVISHHGVLDKGVHFIQKPFSINDIAPIIRESLGKQGVKL